MIQSFDGADSITAFGDNLNDIKMLKGIETSSSL